MKVNTGPVLQKAMKSGLQGKVVVVTGASGGIGSALACAFASEGARVVLHYHTGASAIRVLEKKLSNFQTFTFRADLQKEAEVRKLFISSQRHFGRIDSVIANAGSWESRDVSLEKMSLRQWRKTCDGVLTTCFLTLREFFRVARTQKQGNAVMIASTAAVFGEAGHADYAAAKAAIAYGLTRTLKNEISRIAPHTDKYCGGRVNCICPGWTLVPRTAAKLQNARAITKLTSTMALPQVARPEDIANAAVFLASDKVARHITGQILTIAGGMEGRTLWEPEEVNPAWA
jgi:3-oxoacyl-[acyl-carrier protein] reductase